MPIAAKSAIVESTRMSKAVKALPSSLFRSSMTPKTFSPERRRKDYVRAVYVDD